MNPYKDIIIDEIIHRTFEKEVSESDLVWHRDKSHRLIKVVEGENWKLQFDNSIPFLLEQNMWYNIPSMIYHRLIKGTTNLKILVKEF